MIQPGSKLDRLRDFVSGKKRHFTACFGTPDGKAVLLDLAPYCCAMSPTKTERDQGRRDVWLYIQRRLHLDEEALTALAAGFSAEQRHQLWAPSTTYIEE